MSRLGRWKIEANISTSTVSTQPSTTLKLRGNWLPRPLLRVKLTKHKAQYCIAGIGKEAVHIQLMIFFAAAPSEVSIMTT